ncbi:MAG: hypothetical protein JKX69_13345 [Rhodobacteraceae bacterium]|nr:hypothetical protein [Paracoccaceae bacterium]PHR56228.1 MAG: hypothetical protein COA47_13135 [Robiginitomaculum sp.]
MKIIFIADDLTGALDSSVAFCGRGLSVLCALSPSQLGRALDRGPDVVAVSTNSREAAESKSILAVQQIIDDINARPEWRDAVIFKKVDSRLKGHIEAEVDILFRGRSNIIVCPAIPRLGRLVKNGAIYGTGIETPIDVAQRTGVAASCVPDAACDADLDAVLATIDMTTLFVGAAGLAEALARKIAPAIAAQTPVDLHCPALFAIGSRDPVTLAQLEGFCPIFAPNGNVPAARKNSDQIQVVQMTPGAIAVDPQLAGQRFVDGISAWLTLNPPATLLACGGESAAALMRKVGCGLLKVEGEILTGLPVSQMIDGIEGMKIITKSGGFGAADTLHKLAQKLNDKGYSLEDCPDKRSA